MFVRGPLLAVVVGKADHPQLWPQCDDSSSLRNGGPIPPVADLHEQTLLAHPGQITPRNTGFR